MAMTSQKDDSKKTPLYQWHAGQGASMERFGGYIMPLWYPSGARHEHLSVITEAGLFDTSHMAAVTVNGPDAPELLQWCFTRDLDRCSGTSRTPLKDGELVYGAFLDSQGWCIDDAIVYQVSFDYYMVVVNASMGGRIASHLKSHAGKLRVEIMDLTDTLGKIDIQGPFSVPILSCILREPDVLCDMRFFTFKGHYDPGAASARQVTLKTGSPIMLSRSGYTGEIGFELFTTADKTLDLWESLLKSGRRFGLTPCGLAARDSLRTGAGLPLSHQDIGPWPFINHPWSFALPLSSTGTKFTKNFLGAAALEKCACPEYTFPFVGMDPRKVDHHHASVIDGRGAILGSVLTCVTDTAIDRRDGRIYSIASADRPEDFKPRGLSCGFVRVSRNLHPGDEITLKDKNREIPVQIAKTIRPARTARMPLNKFFEDSVCASAA
jgi:aminomethyltransferase